MKSVAIAFITTPAAVQAYAAAKGQQAHTGAIYVKCPELGFDTEPLYCRYGLPFPYYEVQKDEKVLIEPTFGNDERWFYTGLADSAGAIPTESYVLGDTLKVELQKNVDALTQLQTDLTAWTPVPNDGGASLKAILSAGFLTKTLASLTNILSQVIKGK